MVRTRFEFRVPSFEFSSFKFNFQVSGAQLGRRVLDPKPETRNSEPETRNLDRIPRRKRRRPGPLKVVTAQVTGYINHFPDEVEAGNSPRFHGLR